MLKGFAQFVEQPGVLDGDDGLGGEVLEQRNLLVGERPDLLAVDGDGANQLVLCAAFRLRPGAGTRTGSVARRAVEYRRAAHRAVPAQASLPRTSNRRSRSPACMVPSARTRLLDKLNRSDVRLIVSGHLHQHRDRTFGGQRHLWVSAGLPPRRRMAAMAVAASRCSISHTTVSRSQSNGRAGWSRTTWPRSKVTAAISSCAICRLLLRLTLADVGSPRLPGKTSA